MTHALILLHLLIIPGHCLLNILRHPLLIVLLYLLSILRHPLLQHPQAPLRFRSTMGRQQSIPGKTWKPPST